MQNAVIACFIAIFMLVGTVHGQSVTSENDRKITEINDFILKNPNESDAYNARGLIYYDQKEYNEAISDFSKAIVVCPTKAQYFNNRAQAYSAMGRYEKAIVDYDKSKDLNPNDASTYFNQAELYVKLNKYKEAVNTYYEIVGRIPTDRKNVEKARELVKNMGYLPYNLSSVEMKENAELFKQILKAPIWIEKTIKVRDGDIEKAKKYAIASAKFDARRIYVDKISQENTLRIPRYSVDFSSLMEMVQEDTSGEYGRFVADGTGTRTGNVTFRFLIQCQKVNEINPFIKKETFNKPPTIREFKDFDEYWEIVASGYGFYEGFEDIDYKVGLASQVGIDSACSVIINKITELGITDEDTQKQIINTIKSKRNYGGIYYVLGCGVEVDKRIPIKLYKKDYSIKFIYN